MLLATIAALPALAQTNSVSPNSPAAAAYQTDPAFKKLKLQAEHDSLNPRFMMFAADSWKKANKAAGGKCMECFIGMLNVELSTGQEKKAVQDAEQMDEAADDARYHAFAESFGARALMMQAGTKKPNPELLQRSQVMLQKAISNDPSFAAAYLLQGKVLALLNRDAEASAAFRSYCAHLPKGDPMTVRAEHFAQNPELARAVMAPPVVVTTLAGKQFNLDDMHGRVVLIDFWATWCGPCNRELPHIQKLAAKYSDAPFELISVSWDKDEQKWKDFIAQHGMTWNQYRDADGKLTRAFGIDAIPHYFTIDSDGVLAAENLGSGSDIDGRIDKLVKRAMQDREKESTHSVVPSSTVAGR